MLIVDETAWLPTRRVYPRLRTRVDGFRTFLQVSDLAIINSMGIMLGLITLYLITGAPSFWCWQACLWGSRHLLPAAGFLRVVPVGTPPAPAPAPGPPGPYCGAWPPVAGLPCMCTVAI